MRGRTQYTHNVYRTHTLCYQWKAPVAVGALWRGLLVRALCKHSLWMDGWMLVVEAKVAQSAVLAVLVKG